MRVKDKIEKYLDRLCKIYGGNVIESAKSRYYGFNNHVVRVSDHIGANSSGCISVIVAKNGPTTSYVLHTHSAGDIKVVSYEEAKNFVKNFAMMSSFIADVTNPTFTFEVEKRDAINKDTVVNGLKSINDSLRKENAKLRCDIGKKNPDNKNLILGVPKEMFTEGHLTTINNIIAKIKKDSGQF